MKTIIYVTLFLFTISLNAQISLYSDDIIKPGKVIENATDETPDASIKPGPSGTGLTWNFSALSADDVTSMITMNPDWTPYGFFFPNSNMAMYSPDDDMYMYTLNNTAAFSMLGMYGTFLDSIEMPVIYDPPLILAEFPVNYLNHKESDVSFIFKTPITGVPGVDSAKVKMDVQTTTDVDAWGTMITPLGTFDVLRMLTVEESTDSMWYRMGGIWTISPFPIDKEISYTYSWWSNDNATGFVLCEMDYYAANDSVSDVIFLNSTPTQSLSETETGAILNIYPNPADTYINFDFYGESDALLKIYDNVGKLLLNESVAASTITKISVEDFPAGIYFYKLMENNGPIISNGKFCKK